MIKEPKQICLEALKKELKEIENYIATWKFNECEKELQHEQHRQVVFKNAIKELNHKDKE